MNRYRSDNRIRGGLTLATNESIVRLRNAVRDDRINMRTHIVKENERLDSLAFRFLGDSKLWWVLAACSGIGWSLQVPPGTRISIPLNMEIIDTLM